jgi:microcystin-dependent protein
MEPFIGEIRMFSGDFAPKGWALCQGQLLQANLNQALCSLLGPTYGGDGKITFGLPDLRGRVPIHVNNAGGINLGKKDGTETTTLTAAQLPTHTHTVTGAKIKCNTGLGKNADPSGGFPAGNLGTDYSYIATAGTNEFLASDAIVTTVTRAGGEPINNMMPYLTISYIIALQGMLPSPS